MYIKRPILLAPTLAALLCPDSIHSPDIRQPFSPDSIHSTLDTFADIRQNVTRIRHICTSNSPFWRIWGEWPLLTFAPHWVCHENLWIFFVAFGFVLLQVITMSGSTRKPKYCLRRKVIASYETTRHEMLLLTFRWKTGFSQFFPASHILEDNTTLIFWMFILWHLQNFLFCVINF